MEEPDLWDIADGLAAWFATCPESEDARLPMLVLKLVEEVGEVANALVNHRRGNPRKPDTNMTMNDVTKELGDVIITAAMVLVSARPDARVFFQEHLDGAWRRAREAGAAPLHNQAGMSVEDDDDAIIFRPGQQILKLREAYGVSRADFARLVYQAGMTIKEPNACSRYTVRTWESGDVRSISLRFQRALRHVYANRPHEADDHE